MWQIRRRRNRFCRPRIIYLPIELKWLLTRAERSGYSENRFELNGSNKADEAGQRGCEEGGNTPCRSQSRNGALVSTVIRHCYGTLRHQTSHPVTNGPLIRHLSIVNQCLHKEADWRCGLLSSALIHPLNLLRITVVPAIAAGLSGIVKPAEKTPRYPVPLWSRSFIRQVYPLNGVGLLTENHQWQNKLATDSRVAFFSFYRSAKVGWYLRSKTGRVRAVALELGGVASGDLSMKSGYWAANLVWSRKAVFIMPVRYVYRFKRIFRPSFEIARDWLIN